MLFRSGELKYDPKKYLENVRMAQIRLKDLGYDVEITGYFDDKTLKAVNEFKGNNKLGNIGDWEGVIGPQTWGVLFGVGAVGKITAKPAEKEIEDSLIVVLISLVLKIFRNLITSPRKRRKIKKILTKN